MNKIYVVEGKRDEERLKQLDPNLMVLTTNGFNYNQEFINNLKELDKTNEIIFILDPDYPGEKIRTNISGQLKNCKHIFIPKEIAIDAKKGKVGLEHVEITKLSKLLENEIDFNKLPQQELTLFLLLELGLTGTKNSHIKRNIVTNYFHLPKLNAKKLLKYLNHLGITKKQLIEVLNES